MELYYSPWMKRFLASVSSATQDILLVSPFIKLSLVKPLLLALPSSRSVNLTVVTRLSPFTFQQMASDLSAIELLMNRPGAPGTTRLFKLDRLHAKIYVFDGKRVAIGSSNLSITGMDRNLEAMLWVEGYDLANQVMAGLEANSAFRHPVSAQDFERVRAKLESSPNPPERLAQAVEEADESDLVQHETAESGERELGAPPFEVDEQRQEAIRAFLDARSPASVNALGGLPFESPTVLKDRVAGQPVSPEQKNEERLAASRDLDRLVSDVVPALGITEPAWVPAALSTFVHQSWCNIYPDLLRDGLQRQYFGELGRILLQFRVAIHFAKQISYSAASAGTATIATSEFLKELNFESLLAQQGLNAFLHVGTLGRTEARERFEALVGLLFVARGARIANSFLRANLDDRIAAASVEDATETARTRIQKVAQRLKCEVSYTVKQTGAKQHEPVFECIITVGKRTFGPCSGGSKKISETAAAALALASMAPQEDLLTTRRSYRRYELTPIRSQECVQLARRLGFRERESVALLDIALTHASMQNEVPTTRSYQRLAFVGSFVGRILVLYSTILERGWRKAEAQAISLLRLTGLERELLPEVFDSINLEGLVRFGVGMSKTSLGPSVKADVVQALMAVAYLWEGFEGVQRILWQPLLAPRVARASEKQQADVDPISQLQEQLAKLLKLEPLYRVTQVPGTPRHAPMVEAHVVVDGETVGAGRAPSRKQAKRLAAAEALLWLERKCNQP